MDTQYARMVDEIKHPEQITKVKWEWVMVPLSAIVLVGAIMTKLNSVPSAVSMRSFGQPWRAL